jgi:hypothetical protein
VADVAFNFRQRDRELLAGEADGVTIRAGTSRSANAMHVVRSVLWQVEVEHVTDIGDVQST